MATTVTYKGQTLATVENQTKTLQTAGTWCEDDFTLTDVSGGGSGEWTTEGIATNEEPNGAITVTSTSIGNYAFYAKPITSITALNCTSVGISPFRESSIDEITPTNFPLLNTADISSFTVNKATFKRVYLTASSSNILGKLYLCRDNNQGLQVARFPNCTGGGNQYTFGGCYNLKLVDYGNVTSFGNNAFNNARALQVLILRSTTIVPLSNVSVFTNTPLRGYDSLSAVVYVPSALKASYESASNWSTLVSGGFTTFANLEGSPYENTDFDDSSFIS